MHIYVFIHLIIYLSNPICIYSRKPLYLGVDAEHEGKSAGL